LEVFYSASFPL